MPNGVTAYILNLDGSAARWDAAVNGMDALGLAYVRVAAVDGRNRTLTDFPEYNSAATRRLHQKDLKPSEIGCYLSHIKALKAFLATGDAFCLVLEDDFSLPGPAAVTQAQQAIAWFVQDPANINRLANLGECYPKRSRALHQIEGTTLCLCYLPPILAHAYLWSRGAALDFLADFQGISAPFDYAMQAWACRRGGVVTAQPPIFQQSGVVSDINGVVWNGPQPGPRSLWARRQSFRIKAPLYFYAAWHSARDRFRQQ